MTTVVPLIPNPPFWGDVATVTKYGTLDMRSTKFRKARLRGIPATPPEGYVACVRWGSLTPKIQKELGGEFDEGQWVWIVKPAEH